MVLSAYGIDQKAREDIKNNQPIIPLLVSLLRSNHDEVRRNACFAISVLCVEQAIAIEILRNGALEIVRDLNTSESRKSKFTEMALQRILDSHLSAKYSYLGRLESNNITTDGFYDMGPVRDGGKFLTIEELAAEEVNDRRPILLVYAPEKKKGSESKEKIGTPTTTRTAKTPKASSKERDGKTRTKKDKTNEKRDLSEDKKHSEKDVSGTNNSDSKSGYKLTTDQDFQMYLDEIQPQVTKVPLSEQISTLARFVSEKMGGTISPDDVATFGYEVAMNQLKTELHSNVIPIGRIRKGIHAQRAFLFKTLADRLGIPCTLTRGNYNRAWNEVILGQSSGAVRYPAKTWIVDLLHEPGRLLLANSSDARIYTILS
ncbi:unnamed protein product [Rotaria sp. Silwood1]|nr:unnamed protein product [Rotaria sp. Silwood1]